MKNLSLILNVVLVIAVSYLYYLNFSKPAMESGVPTARKISSDSLMHGDNIVFVNSDSLLENYDYLNKLKKELEAKTERLSNEVNAGFKALEKEIQRYQQDAPTMSPNLRQITEENLVKKEQALQKRKEAAYDELAKEEEKLQDKLHDDLNNFLKEYNKEYNYNFILGYSRGGGILLANDSLDITQDVIQGLNAAQQKAEKK